MLVHALAKSSSRLLLGIAWLCAASLSLAENPKDWRTAEADPVAKRLLKSYETPSWFRKAGFGVSLAPLPEALSEPAAKKLVEAVHHAGAGYLVAPATAGEALTRLRDEARRRGLKFGLKAAGDPLTNKLLDTHKPEYLQVRAGRLSLSGVGNFPLVVPEGESEGIKALTHYYGDDLEASHASYKKRVICMEKAVQEPWSHYEAFTPHRVGFPQEMQTRHRWRYRSWQKGASIRSNEATLTGPQTIQELVDAASTNANLLLRVPVGPSGELDTEIKQALLALGEWMAVNGLAIRAGNQPSYSHFPPRDDQNRRFITYYGKTYMVLFEGPTEPIHLPWLYCDNAHEVTAVKMLATGEKLEFKQPFTYSDEVGGLFIQPPKKRFDSPAWVIQIDWQDTTP